MCNTFWNNQLLLNWPKIATIQLISMSMTMQGHFCMHSYSIEGWLHNPLTFHWNKTRNNNIMYSVWFLQLLFVYIFYSYIYRTESKFKHIFINGIIFTSQPNPYNIARRYSKNTHSCCLSPQETGLFNYITI